MKKAKWEKSKFENDRGMQTIWILKKDSITAKISKTNNGALLNIFEDGQSIASQMGGTIASAKLMAETILKY
jgi:hypothetical protein